MARSWIHATTKSPRIAFGWLYIWHRRCASRRRRNERWFEGGCCDRTIRVITMAILEMPLYVWLETDATVSKRETSTAKQEVHAYSFPGARRRPKCYMEGFQQNEFAIPVNQTNMTIHNNQTMSPRSVHSLPGHNCHTQNYDSEAVCFDLHPSDTTEAPMYHLRGMTS